ncbi:MAG TPA: hypothetical protein PKY96_19125 [Flavobacteriales bacterium]|nr:hypothetical protein [Flavobacteriales bacterium]
MPNPSFEENTACPVTIGFQGFSKPLHWEKWNQSPDYFHTCAGSLGGVDTLIRVPLNGFGFQYSMHGDAYVGMYAYGTTGGGVNYREYAGCQLLEPLEVGESYDLSFFTNVAFGGNYWPMTWACNNMGMLFTMEQRTWTGNGGIALPLPNHAHLYSPAIFSDTANWTVVSGSFVADSAYQYLVLGNFFSNALTDTLHLVPGPSLGAYFFVDGVCVRKTGQPCEFTIGISEPEMPGPYLWPNPTSEVIQVRAGVGTRWQVFDASGRLMADGVSATELLELPVHRWAPGEYVLRLQGEARRHVRFVVMR